VPIIKVDGKKYDYAEYEEKIKPQLKAEMYDEWRKIPFFKKIIYITLAGFLTLAEYANIIYFLTFYFIGGLFITLFTENFLLWLSFIIIWGYILAEIYIEGW